MRLHSVGSVGCVSKHNVRRTNNSDWGHTSNLTVRLVVHCPTQHISNHQSLVNNIGTFVRGITDEKCRGRLS